jgi:hypothetical protein
MNKNKNSAELQETVAGQAAQHLANLLQQPVAGFEPEAINNNRSSPDEIVDGLISGRLKAKPFRKDNPDLASFKVDAPFIVISGLMHGDQNLRQRIMATVDPTRFRDQYRAEIFRTLKELVESNRITRDEIDGLRGRVPDIWNASHPQMLEGYLGAGVIYRWYQMVDWQCDPDLVEQAIAVMTSNP